MHRAGCLVIAVSIPSEFDMAQPLAVAGAERLDDVLREPALGGKPFELGDHRFDRRPPRFLLFHSIVVLLAPAGIDKAENADDPRQEQTLAHQGHEYDREGEE